MVAGDTMLKHNLQLRYHEFFCKGITFYQTKIRFLFL